MLISGGGVLGVRQFCGVVLCLHQFAAEDGKRDILLFAKLLQKEKWRACTL